MPSYTISPSAYFDKIGPFDRPLTRLVLQSTDDVVSPAPPLTTEPGEQWLCLTMSLLGGRQVGIFGDAGNENTLAVQVRSTGTAVSTLAKWMKTVRRYHRHGAPNAYVQNPFEVWMIPSPYPPGMSRWLRDVTHMQQFSDPLLMVNEEGMTFLELLDPLFDLGAMYWRIFPGHLRLQLDTRFVGPRDLERHLERIADMAGVDLWPTKV